MRVISTVIEVDELLGRRPLEGGTTLVDTFNRIIRGVNPCLAQMRTLN